MKPGDISGPKSTAAPVACNSAARVQRRRRDFTAKRDQIRDTLLQGKQGELFGLFLTQPARPDGKVGKIKSTRTIKGADQSGKRTWNVVLP